MRKGKGFFQSQWRKKLGKLTKKDTEVSNLIGDIERGVFTQEDTGQKDKEGKPIMETVEQKIKNELKKRTDEAFKKGIYGLPSFWINNKIF